MADQPASRRFARFGRWVLRAIGVVLVLAGLLGLAGLITIESGWFKHKVRGWAMAAANSRLNGQLTIGGLGGNLFSGVELRDVSLVMRDGVAFTIPVITVKYRISAVASAGHIVDEIDVDRPEIYLRHTHAGWNLAHLMKPSPTPSRGGGATVGIRRIVLHGGTLHIDTGATGARAAVQWPAALEPLNGEVALAISPGRQAFTIRRMAFQASTPPLRVTSLTGGFTIEPDRLAFSALTLDMDAGTMRVNGTVPKAGHDAPFNLQLASGAVALPVLGRLIPRVRGIPLTPSIDISLSGPLSRLAVTADVGSSAGRVGAAVTADLAGGARRLAGTVTLTHLNLAPWLERPGVASDITGTVRAEASFGPGPLSIRYRFQSPSATVAGYHAAGIAATGTVDKGGVDFDASGRAYRGRVTSKGRLTFPAGPGHHVVFDLSGRTQDVDLSTLPRHLGLTRIQTRLNTGYKLTGEWPKLQAQFALDRSTAIGAEIAAGSTGGFSLAGPELAYAAAGQLAHLDLRRVGEAFDVRALTDQRYATDLSGRFQLHVTGTTLARLAIDATAHLVSSAAFSGQVEQADATAHLRQRRLSVQAKGNFRRIDLVQAFAMPALRGVAGGTADGTVTFDDLALPTGVDNLEWNGRIDLADSVLDGTSITSASFDGRYARRVADVRRLTVDAPIVQGEASGTLDLGDTGTSDLRYTISQIDLGRLGDRLGRALGGLATAQGTLTGNAGLLETSGHLTGAPVAFGSWEAIDIEADYRASMPQFDRTRLTGTANLTTDTLAEGTQTIADAIVLHAAYQDRRLAFSGSMQSSRYTLDAAGAWTPPAGGSALQTIDLRTLSLSTPGALWKLAPGMRPHVEIGAGRLAVADVRLLHGSESIAASGVLGGPGQPLRIDAAGVDLGVLDRLVPEAPPVSGVIQSAQAVVTGTPGRPVVDAHLVITGGSYRSIQNIRVDAGGRYEAGVIALNARLDQPSSGAMTVDGRLPVALFNRSPGASSTPLDLKIQGQQISLGLVTGFTGAVTEVRGNVNADVHVIGTAAAPRAEGTIDLTGGAVTIPATGVRYSGITARVKLAGDRADVEQLVVQDPRKRTLDASGSLVIDGRTIRVARATIQSGDFTVLNNTLAVVTIDSRVQMKGTLAQPTLTGAVTLRSASLNADRLLALVSRGATTPAPLVPPAPSEAAPSPSNAVLGPPAPGPSPLSGLTVDVTVTAPDNLIVSGSQLAGSSSPIGVGSLELALGGTVRVQKDPDGPVRIAGTMSTVRGSYAFQGRRFDIQRGGQIQFRGQSPIDPLLNIAATLAIQGVQTTVNVQGALREPRLALTSSPPLDEADILSLIVFNQPINQLGEQQQASLVSRASLMAAGALASSVAQSIGRALNLSIFEIEPSPATGATAAVTVGQQIGSRLFLKVSQAIGRESATQFTVDYFLTSFMRLQSEITQGPFYTQTMLARTDRTNVELVFFFSY